MFRPGPRKVKSLARFPSGRPPSATSGGVSALSGSFSSSPALPARAILHPTLSLGMGRSARGCEHAFHPSPLLPSLFPIHSSQPLSFLVIPIPGDARAPLTQARDPAGDARREGPGHKRSGNPTHPSPPPAPRPSTRRSRVRGPTRAQVWLVSRLAATASSSACRVLAGASTRPVRWLAGAHAPVRAPGRGEQHEPRRCRCGRAGAPAPGRGSDSQPSGRRRREAGLRAVGAGRRPALGELWEERSGDGGGGSRRPKGGGGASFLFSDPGASGTQSPELEGRGDCGGPA